jgi:uncharacterized protein YbaR (Trm112 family)
MSALDPFLLEVIACPQCHGPLSAGPEHLDCPTCSLRFPIVDGIAVLLLDEARPWPVTTQDGAMA